MSRSVNVDFSEAPLGTTHWGPASDDSYECWYRQVGSSWYCVRVDANRTKLTWVALGCQFHRKDLVARPYFQENLREHESGNGFTLTTNDPKSAFAMAEKMVFSGNNYSIKLSGVKGGEWVLVVTEVAA